MRKKIVSGFLLLSLLCANLQSVFAAWDGYLEPLEKEDAVVNDEVVIVDMNNIGNIFNSGAVPSSKIKRDAMYSLAWTDMVGNKDLQFKSVPRDLSECDTVVLNIYSEKATNTDFIFAIWCELVPIAGATNSYYSYKITIDWEGWKTFELSLKNQFSRSNLAELNAVTYVRITNNGWGCTASSEAAIYFDSIVAKKDAKEDGEVSLTAPGAIQIPYTEEDKTRYTSMAGNSFSLVEYSRNVYSNGKNTVLDKDNPYAKVIVIDDVGYVPDKFFTNFVGKRIPSGTEGLWENGIYYVPILKTAEKLGISAKEYNSLYVVGNAANFTALDTDESARVAGAYMTSGIESFVVSPKAFKQIKDNWRYSLVGDKNNNLSNELIAKTIGTISDNGQKAWETFKQNKDNPNIIFSSVTTTAHMTEQYGYINDMAKAYGTKGSALYKNKELKNDIIAAIDFGYELYYGNDEMNNRPWNGGKNDNWWDWGVGVPRDLLDALIVIENDVTQQQIDKWVAPITHMVNSQVGTSRSRGTQSMQTCALGIAVLTKDSEMFKNAIWYLDDLLIITQPRVLNVDGLKEDGTYLMHNDFTYNGGYGVSLIGENGMGMLNAFAGTGLEIPSPNISNMLFAVYETFEPIVYEGGIMSPFIGRSVGQELNTTNNLLSYLLNIIGIFGQENDKNIKAFVKRNITDGNIGKLASILSVEQALLLTDILNDDTISGENTYERAKMYHNGDKAVWFSNGYAASLSMSSERQAAWESINGANKDGWYVSDGALYVYTDSTYLPYGGGWWSAKNPYHIPGTTVDTQERKAVSVDHTEDYISSQDFVGGVELSGKYMTAAMSLESFHNDKDTGRKDTGGGGAMPLHTSTLTAKKSYFFFDDEIVALGSDIRANDGFDVHTVVENRKLVEKQNGMTELEVVSLTSTGDDGNVVENIQDDNLETRWSLSGTEGCYFVAELKETSVISHAGLAFFNATGGNAAVFDLEVSMDGKKWTTVYTGQSSGEGSQMEAFPMGNVTAKYVRYNGHGRVNSLWNSVTEFKVYPASEDGSMKVAFSESDDSVYGTEDIVIDGQLLEKVGAYDKEFANPRYAYVEGMGGYYFNTPDNLFVKKSGSYNNFLEMWFSHGVSPQGKTYAYTLLPDKTAKESEIYSQNPDVLILQNDEKIQAVREKNTNATGVVFWQAGTLGKVTVNKPLICMLEEKDKLVTLSVCDPTGKLENASITIDGNYSLISKDDKMSITTNREKATVSVDFTNSNGRSITVTLKKN